MNLLSEADRYRLVAGPLPEFQREFERDVRAGLESEPRTLPCRYIYDARGSRLFEEICALPEYYPTRLETALLGERATEIVAPMGRDFDLVELGSGNARKTRLLIDAALRIWGSARYLPIDISQEPIESSAEELLAEYSKLEIHAILAPYLEGLLELKQVPNPRGRPRMVAWLGSSIGNLSRPAAQDFMYTVRRQLSTRDAVLMGIDLRKSARELELAYDDPRGVTASFNKNILLRINNELGGDFELENFRYRARYDEASGRVAMSLSAERACHVQIVALDTTASFEAGTSIHTEDAYKYSHEEVEELAAVAGFRVQEQWCDERDRYSLSLLKPS